MRRFIPLIIAISLFLTPALVQAGLKPMASLRASIMAGGVDTVFEFDGSASLNSYGTKTGLKFRFHSADDHAVFTSWGSSAKYSHKYSRAGEFQVTMEVQDSYGLIDKTYVKVTVLSLVSPDIYFEVEPHEGTTETNFRFQAFPYSNIYKDREDFLVRWDFDGDGEFDTSWEDKLIDYHIYSKGGSFAPKLEVKDPTGNVYKAKGYITETDTQGRIRVYERATEIEEVGNPPRASFTADRYQGKIGSTFYFDASTSWDPEDKKDVEVRWDFENNGWDTVFSQDKKISHNFAVPGAFLVTLEAKDSGGNKDITQKEIVVFPDSHEEPLPVLKIDPEFGTTGTRFKLNAGDSEDGDGKKSGLEYRFDFEGDGVFDTPFSTQKIAYYYYRQEGQYHPLIEVRDKDDRTSKVTSIVYVVANTPPEASFETDRDIGTISTEFRFDAKESEDAQDGKDKLTYAWDFDGDLRPDTEFRASSTYRKVFASTGEKKVAVFVKDQDNDVGTYSRKIMIVKNTPPAAKAEVSPNNAFMKERFTVDPTASFDNQDVFKKLECRFDFDSLGSGDIDFDTDFISCQKKYVYYDKPGQKYIKVQVRDQDGAIDEKIMSVYVHWSSEYVSYLRKKGVTNKSKYEDYRPDDPITRAELAKMILKARKVKVSTSSLKITFKDVSKKAWYAPYVVKAKEQGLIAGYGDGSFRPNQAVSRAEALKIILLAYDVFMDTAYRPVFKDVAEDDWSAAYIMKANQMGIVDGYSGDKFKPNNQLTRAEAAKIIYEMMQIYE